MSSKGSRNAPGAIKAFKPVNLQSKYQFRQTDRRFIIITMPFFEFIGIMNFSKRPKSSAANNKSKAFNQKTSLRSNNQI